MNHAMQRGSLDATPRRWLRRAPGALIALGLVAVGAFVALQREPAAAEKPSETSAARVDPEPAAIESQHVFAATAPVVSDAAQHPFEPLPPKPTEGAEPMEDFLPSP